MVRIPLPASQRSLLENGQTLNFTGEPDFERPHLIILLSVNDILGTPIVLAYHLFLNRSTFSALPLSAAAPSLRSRSARCTPIFVRQSALFRVPITSLSPKALGVSIPESGTLAGGFCGRPTFFYFHSRIGSRALGGSFPRRGRRRALVRSQRRTRREKTFASSRERSLRPAPSRHWRRLGDTFQRSCFPLTPLQNQKSQNGGHFL